MPFERLTIIIENVRLVIIMTLCLPIHHAGIHQGTDYYRHQEIKHASNIPHPDIETSPPRHVDPLSVAELGYPSIFSLRLFTSNKPHAANNAAIPPPTKKVTKKRLDKYSGTSMKKWGYIHVKLLR